jgi:hypothetical protein
MGSIFGFVCSDVKSKIEILEEFRENKEVLDKFESVKKMIVYERDSELLCKKDYVSGSRTLLRLHRGLGRDQKHVVDFKFLFKFLLFADFIRSFLQKLGDLEANDKTSTVCSQSYNDTLANFHPFLIRKAANLAMYALPTRDNLLQKVCCDVESSIKQLPYMLEISNEIYDRVEALYTEFNLHNLP